MRPLSQRRLNQQLGRSQLCSSYSELCSIGTDESESASNSHKHSRLYLYRMHCPLSTVIGTGSSNTVLFPWNLRAGGRKSSAQVRPTSCPKTAIGTYWSIIVDVSAPAWLCNALSGSSTPRQSPSLFPSPPTQPRQSQACSRQRRGHVA